MQVSSQISNQKSTSKAAIQVIDLHCDLLSFISGGARFPQTPRSAYDESSRASIHQLRMGQVFLQTLAIYTPTVAWSVRSGLRQASIYHSLSKSYPGVFAAWGNNNSAEIRTRLAIENASSFCTESEPLEAALKRFDWLAREVEVPLYVSLTWNDKNRFGGGAHAQGVGLTSDGKVLLEWAKKWGVLIDLSHASDKLAEDILAISGVRVMASHSNFRNMCPVARNLPDEIASEIVSRNGIIGMNLIKPFLGNDSKAFLRHVEYALHAGYEDGLAIGADFFSVPSIPKKNRKTGSYYFYDEFSNASTYPLLKILLEAEFGSCAAEKIFFKNAYDRLIK